MSEITLEIRAAEGGDDAKLLVHDQATIYRRYAARHGLQVRESARGRL